MWAERQVWADIPALCFSLASEHEWGLCAHMACLLSKNLFRPHTANVIMQHLHWRGFTSKQGGHFFQSLQMSLKTNVGTICTNFVISLLLDFWVDNTHQSSKWTFELQIAVLFYNISFILSCFKDICFFSLLIDSLRSWSVGDIRKPFLVLYVG